MLLVVFLKVMSFYLIFKKKVWMKSSVIFSNKKNIAQKKSKLFSFQLNNCLKVSSQDKNQCFM